MIRDAASESQSRQSALKISSDMAAIRTALETLYGKRRSARFLASRGNDPSKYQDLLARYGETDTRRINAGEQIVRDMPTPSNRRFVGRLDDDLRDEMLLAASRGVGEEAVRARLLSKFGSRRLEAFETECPNEIADSVMKVALRLGAADEEGYALFQRQLDEKQGNVDAAVNGVRRMLGRVRAARLLTEHAGIAAAVGAASRLYGEAGESAADRRVGGYAAATRRLAPEAAIDFEAIAREAAAQTVQEYLPSPYAGSSVDPTLVASPTMEGTEIETVASTEVTSETIADCS
jgi:hypothetical protein